MARDGIIYFVIYKQAKSVHLAWSPADAKDIQLVDHQHGLVFPEETPIRRVVGSILGEVALRSRHSPSFAA
jgi:hypothetical protein